MHISKVKMVDINGVDVLEIGIGDELAPFMKIGVAMSMLDLGDCLRDARMIVGMFDIKMTENDKVEEVEQ